MGYIWENGKKQVVWPPQINKRDKFNKSRPECYYLAPVEHYSEDIAAAFEVVDFVRSKDYRFHLYEHDKKSPGDDFTGWVAGFTSREPMKMNSQWQGETRPLAICRAFLVLELE
jgi:hypothetical protein